MFIEKTKKGEKDVTEKIIALAISISTLIHLYYQIRIKSLEIKKLKLEIKNLEDE